MEYKRKDYPISFRVKKEIIDELANIANELYGGNKTKTLVKLIENNNLKRVEELEEENKRLKRKVERVEKLIRELDKRG